MARRVTRRIRIPAPGHGAVAPLGPQILAEGRTFPIVALGDSIIWGQGLRPSENLKNRIRRALGGIHGVPGKIVWDRSHSGARTRAFGNTAKLQQESREAYIDRFPTLFESDTERQNFASGTSEFPATRLFGEVPADFPTVGWQVRSLGTRLGKSAEVVLLCGGVNDIGIDNVINPEFHRGAFIEYFESRIEGVFFDRFYDLLKLVREKLPNAIILVFGYYAPISYSSHVSKIRSLLKHEFDDDFGWYINKAIDYFGFTGGPFRDIDAVIREVKARSVWAHGRALHWARSSVANANLDPKIRGPGIIFVPAGIDAGRAAFANNPELFSDYTDPTGDSVREQRVKYCPRADQLGALTRLFRGIVRRDYQSHLPTYKWVKDLRAALAAEGPVSLATDLSAYYARNLDSTQRLLEALGNEIKRIRTALIGSFLHPNAAGASRYADNAVRRYRNHRALVAELSRGDVTGDLSAVAGGQESLDALLRRYKVRGPGPLLGDIGHLDVDAIRVTATTSANSDKNLAPSVSLVVGTLAADGKRGQRVYQLNFPYVFTLPPGTSAPRPGSAIVSKMYPQLEPGKKDIFTIDTLGRLRLSEIASLRLRVNYLPYDARNTHSGKVWRPRNVRIEFNGKRVLTRNAGSPRLHPGDFLDLEYPPQAPRVANPRARRVRA